MALVYTTRPVASLPEVVPAFIAVAKSDERCQCGEPVMAGERIAIPLDKEDSALGILLREGCCCQLVSDQHIVTLPLAS